MPTDIRLLIGTGACLGVAWSAWLLRQRHASRVATSTVKHEPAKAFEAARFSGKPLHLVAILDPFWPRAFVDTTVTATAKGPRGVDYKVSTHWFSWGPEITFRGSCEDLSDPNSQMWASLVADDGSWVVVSDGEARSRSRVLSTTAALPPAVLQDIRAQLAQRGFDASPSSLRDEVVSRSSTPAGASQLS